MCYNQRANCTIAEWDSYFSSKKKTYQPQNNNQPSNNNTETMCGTQHRLQRRKIGTGRAQAEQRSFVFQLITKMEAPTAALSVDKLSSSGCGVCRSTTTSPFLHEFRSLAESPLRASQLGRLSVGPSSFVQVSGSGRDCATVGDFASSDVAPTASWPPRSC